MKGTSLNLYLGIILAFSWTDKIKHEKAWSGYQIFRQSFEKVPSVGLHFIRNF